MSVTIILTTQDTLSDSLQSLSEAAHNRRTFIYLASDTKPSNTTPASVLSGSSSSDERHNLDPLLFGSRRQDISKWSFDFAKRALNIPEPIVTNSPVESLCFPYVPLSKLKEKGWTFQISYNTRFDYDGKRNYQRPIFF